MCHCASVGSSILSTTVESFDRHYAVNVRATWLLIKAFAEQLDVLWVDHAWSRGSEFAATRRSRAAASPQTCSR